MRIVQAAFCIFDVDSAAWSADWAWGLPLIVLTVVIHVSWLSVLGPRAIHVASLIIERSHSRIAFVATVGTTTLLAICLHGIEVVIWAVSYLLLGALPDIKSPILYSLNAMTSYGHTNLSLEKHWQLMGALEALNGWLLFGLTTAFLFAVIQKILLLEGKEVQR